MAGKGTVILLEDDAALRGLMADGLRDLNYRVIEAASVAAAARAIEDLAGRAVLVADRSLGTGMPNGFDAAQEALAAYPALRAVYTTGSLVTLRNRRLSDRERSLPKPFALSQLVSVVRHLS